MGLFKGFWSPGSVYKTFCFPLMKASHFIIVRDTAAVGKFLCQTIDALSYMILDQKEWIINKREAEEDT